MVLDIINGIFVGNIYLWYLCYLGMWFMFYGGYCGVAGYCGGGRYFGELILFLILLLPLTLIKYLNFGDILVIVNDGIECEFGGYCGCYICIWIFDVICWYFRYVCFCFFVFG